MNNIKKFVTKILKGFLNDEDKKELIEILTTSLEEKVDDLVELGATREEAIKQSIQEFGDESDVLEVLSKYENREIIKYRLNKLMFSSLAYIIITGLTIYVNYQFVPTYNWFLFVAIGLLFWPLTMLYLYLNVRR